MNITNLDQLASSLAVAAYLSDIQVEEIVETMRKNMELMKTMADQPDVIVAAGLTIGQIHAIPHFDRDREIVDQLLTTMLGQLAVSTYALCGLNLEEIDNLTIATTIAMLEPLRLPTLNALIPLN